MSVVECQKRAPLALRSLQTSASGSKLVGKDPRDMKSSNQTESKLKSQKSYSKIVNFFQKKSKSVGCDPTENLNAVEDKQKEMKAADMSAIVEEYIAQKCDMQVQTEVCLTEEVIPSENEMRDVMFSPSPTLLYWKLLAEQRGKDLQEQADENLQMAMDLGRVNEENRELRVLAEEGQRFADILKEIVEQQSQTQETQDNNHKHNDNPNAESGYFDDN